MQKILALVFIFVFCAGAAFGNGNWGNKAANDWWGPGVVFSGIAWYNSIWEETLLRRAKESWDNKTNYILVVFMARKLVPHGGYFCATQVRGRNAGTEPPIEGHYTEYQETTPTAKCFWMCEPGYTGENCKAATENDLCENIKPTKEYLNQFDYNKSGGQFLKSGIRNQGVMDAGYGGWATYSENDVIVVAHGFDQADGRGILASPATSVAYTVGCWGIDRSCTFIKISRDIDISGDNKDVKTNILLCSQGYSGPNCAKKCNECATEKEKPGADGKCVPKNSWTMNEMMSKTYKHDGKDIPCWNNSDIAKYQECMKK